MHSLKDFQERETVASVSLGNRILIEQEEESIKMTWVRKSCQRTAIQA